MAKGCTRYDWVAMAMTNVSAKGEGEKWLWNVCHKVERVFRVKFPSGTHGDMPDLECRRRARARINAKAAKYHFGKQVNVNTTISMVSGCGKDLSKPNHCKRNMKYINYTRSSKRL
jgi:hypothetical protein